MRKVIFYKLALFSVAAVITNFLYYVKFNHKSIIFFVVYIGSTKMLDQDSIQSSVNFMIQYFPFPCLFHLLVLLPRNDFYFVIALFLRNIPSSLLEVCDLKT